MSASIGSQDMVRLNGSFDSLGRKHPLGVSGKVYDGISRAGESHGRMLGLVEKTLEAWSSAPVVI